MLFLTLLYRLKFKVGAIQPSQVHKASWYMLHYGGPTPKRHYAFSNSRHVSALNRGRLRGWVQKNKTVKGKKHELVDKYKDSTGRQRFKGNKSLRASEWDP